MTLKWGSSHIMPVPCLARFTFCWWRHNRLAMTSQWPDNCDANTWQVISNSLDIDFIHGVIHGRSCKKCAYSALIDIANSDHHNVVINIFVLIITSSFSLLAQCAYTQTFIWTVSYVIPVEKNPSRNTNAMYIILKDPIAIWISFFISHQVLHQIFELVLCKSNKLTNKVLHVLKLDYISYWSH